jgi:hypothetical protein
MIRTLTTNQDGNSHVIISADLGKGTLVYAGTTGFHPPRLRPNRFTVLHAYQDIHDKAATEDPVVDSDSGNSLVETFFKDQIITLPIDNCPL